MGEKVSIWRAQTRTRAVHRTPSVMWIKAEPQNMFQIEFKIMFWVISALLRSVRDLNYGQPKSNQISDSLLYIWSNCSLVHITVIALNGIIFTQNYYYIYWTNLITLMVFCENKRWVEFIFHFCCLGPWWPLQNTNGILHFCPSIWLFQWLPPSQSWPGEAGAQGQNQPCRLTWSQHSNSAVQFQLIFCSAQQRLEPAYCEIFNNEK